MKLFKNDCSDSTEPYAYPTEAERNGTLPLYNNGGIQEVIMKAGEGFAERLYQLRSAKNVSAREMSLDLGLGAGYINNLENGNNMPSMTTFFLICEYLDVSPAEYFAYADDEVSSPAANGPGASAGAGHTQAVHPLADAAEIRIMLESLEPEDREYVTKLIMRLAKG